MLGIGTFASAKRVTRLPVATKGVLVGRCGARPMVGRCRHPGLIVLLVAIATAALTPQLGGNQPVEPPVERREEGPLVVGPNREIFDNPAAVEKVRQARSFDPMYCRQEARDRDKAVSLYREAMALQPGARINAVLARRIAVLYTSYADRPKGVRPDPATAARWWRTCIQETSPKQLLWGQAHIGLASASVMGRDPGAATAAYEQVLTMDPNEVELPDWKQWPQGNTEYERAALQKELDRARAGVVRIHKRAVEKIFYVSVRRDLPTAIAAMNRIARTYPGTPAAEQARMLVSRRMERVAGDDWLDLPEPAFLPKALDAQAALEADAEGAENDAPEPPVHPSPTGRPAVGPPPAKDSRANGLPVIAVGAITLGAACLAAAFFLARRRTSVQGYHAGDTTVEEANDAHT